MAPELRTGPSEASGSRGLARAGPAPVTCPPRGLCGSPAPRRFPPHSSLAPVSCCHCHRLAASKALPVPSHPVPRVPGKGPACSGCSVNACGPTRRDRRCVFSVSDGGSAVCVGNCRGSASRPSVCRGFFGRSGRHSGPSGLGHGPSAAPPGSRPRPRPAEESPVADASRGPSGLRPNSSISPPQRKNSGV